MPVQSFSEWANSIADATPNFNHMKNLRLLCFVSFLAAALLSCSDDDETPDPVSKAVGTYNYRIKFYILDGTKLLYLGASTDETGSAILSKTLQGFEVKEGGVLFFAGSKVAVASNGFTFDIESQTVDMNGDDVVITGFDGATLGTVKYNGLYESASQKLTGYMQFDAVLLDENDEEVGVIPIVLEFIGTKV